MADARRMGKSELFSSFAERFEVKRTQAREYFDYLTELAEKELKRSGEFVLPGMVKLVVARDSLDVDDAWLYSSSRTVTSPSSASGRPPRSTA